MSIGFIRPAANTIAFGGVATGSINAYELKNVFTKKKNTGWFMFPHFLIKMFQTKGYLNGKSFF